MRAIALEGTRLSNAQIKFVVLHSTKTMQIVKAAEFRAMKFVSRDSMKSIRLLKQLRIVRTLCTKCTMHSPQGSYPAPRSPTTVRRGKLHDLLAYKATKVVKAAECL